MPAFCAPAAAFSRSGETRQDNDLVALARRRNRGAFVAKLPRAGRELRTPAPGFERRGGHQRTRLKGDCKRAGTNSTGARLFPSDASPRPWAETVARRAFFRLRARPNIAAKPTAIIAHVPSSGTGAARRQLLCSTGDCFIRRDGHLQCVQVKDEQYSDNGTQEGATEKGRPRRLMQRDGSQQEWLPDLGNQRRESAAS
jgi:hypothetical protein